MSVGDRIVLGVLCVDGAVAGLLSVAFLTIYAGPVPLPVSAVLGALVTGGLVRVAAGLTSGRARLLPLLGWLVPVAAALWGGPGSDAVLLPDWRTLLLIAAGVGVPVAVSWLPSSPPPRARPSTPEVGDGA